MEEKTLHLLQIQMNEIWRPTGLKDTLVSNLGRIKRRDGFLYTLQKCKSNGYNYVHLSYNNHTKAFKVARLVAKAFIDNPDNKKYVDHINTVRTDDRADNLRWVTASENNLNSISREHKKATSPKVRPWKYRAILQYDRQGNFIKEWESISAFCISINKSIKVSSNIIACIKGKQPTAYGYKWKYK